jgi:Fe-Mn family superoxide dismutase
VQPEAGEIVSLTLPPLPYALEALEPHISRRTLAAHHGRHHAGYVEKTRTLVKDTPLESASLEGIVRSALPTTALFASAAQAWNHGFYWQCMRPGGGGEARGPIADLIEKQFGSGSAFRHEFLAAAGDRFGSGWVWLVLDDGGDAKIISTPNAETPITSTQVPLLTVDVWEHAYYLDFQHRRLDYVDAFLTYLVNWEFANRNLSVAGKATTADQVVRHATITR